MILAATGHRPEKVGGYDNRTRLALGGLATEYLCRARPEKVISGMALGWDQAVAAAALALGIPLVAAVPFEGQEGRWPEEAQARYARLLASAAEVHVIRILEHGTAKEAAEAMQARNEWMVDRADRLLALWDGSWGGTFNCIKYAEKVGVQHDNLWARWSLPADVRELL